MFILCYFVFKMVGGSRGFSTSAWKVHPMDFLRHIQLHTTTKVAPWVSSSSSCVSARSDCLGHTLSGVCSRSASWPSDTKVWKMERRNTSRTLYFSSSWTEFFPSLSLPRYSSWSGSRLTKLLLMCTPTTHSRTWWAAGVSTRRSSTSAFHCRSSRRRPRSYPSCWWERSFPSEPTTGLNIRQRWCCLSASSCSSSTAKIVFDSRVTRPRSPAFYWCVVIYSSTHSPPTGRVNCSANTTCPISRWWPARMYSPSSSPACHYWNRAVSRKRWTSWLVFPYSYSTSRFWLRLRLSANCLYFTQFTSLARWRLPSSWRCGRRSPSSSHASSTTTLSIFLASSASSFSSWQFSYVYITLKALQNGERQLLQKDLPKTLLRSCQNWTKCKRSR